MTGINTLRGLAVGFAAMALCLGSAGLAVAKDATVFAPRDNDMMTARVSFADLNLATAIGRKRLEYRVGSAVEQVCPSGFGLTEMLDARVCSNKAWDGARPQMALAFTRAAELAATGTSRIAPVAIAIIAPAAR